MGIYDRDYYRSGRPSFTLSVPRSAVVTLILINAAVYVAENLVPSLLGTLGVYVGTLTHPLYWWQFLTYGFTHALEPQHVLFNMLGLWFLGRDVEALYGPREFTRLYLAMVIVGGVAWAAANRLSGHIVGGPLIGASGAVTGIVVLYALHFPRRMMLFMFVIPMPAWVLGLLIVLNDIWGAIGLRNADNIAYGVHVAGAAFAFLYYQQGWNFGRLVPKRFAWRGWSRPKLQVHHPLREDDDISDEEVDRILEKIHREGEGSLSRKERRILENASREYQRRRQGP